MFTLCIVNTLHHFINLFINGTCVHLEICFFNKAPNKAEKGFVAFHSVAISVFFLTGAPKSLVK